MNKLTYQLISVIVLLALTFGSYSNIGASSALAGASTYYVSASGNDANAGTSSAPFKTIQKCLNVVAAGGGCLVAAGTYNEALTLKVTGTAALPITLKCQTPLGCTVNSGSSRSLVTYDGRQIGYHIVDGFRFLSTITNNTSDPMYANVNFAYNYWGDGDKLEKGNDGFILRNCYVEGAVYFFGSNNLVENCELNGKGVVSNGLTERSQPSENNVFRNNTIHDYTVRGGWTLQYVQNSLWTGNTFYKIAPNGGGAAIDCDGAGHAVYRCNIKNNLFYGNGATQAIEMENAFDSVIEGNTIRDGKTAIHVINYNISNGSDPFKADKDYKGLTTNTAIRNNVIYNMSGMGISCHAVKGIQATNNTLYKISGNAFDFQTYTQIGCPDWTVKNNIVAQTSKSISLISNSPVADANFYETFSASISGSGTKTFPQWQVLGYDAKGKTGSPLFVNAAAGNFNLQTNSAACGTGAFPCSSAASAFTLTTNSTLMQTTTIPTVIPSFTPTLTWTNTPVAPTATASPVPVLPTATATATMSTVVVTASLVPVSPTVTASPVPVLPTATATAIKPTVVVTASLVPVSPTVTASPVPVLPTATATATMLSLPTATASPMPVVPTATLTTAPPTASPVPVLPTATATATMLSLPTATASPIPAVPTFTQTSAPPTVAVETIKPAASETMYDDKNSAFVYSADWEKVSHRKAFKGSFRQTNKKDSFVTFTFTGQSFSLLYKSGPEFSNMKVYVDDVLVETINEKSTSPSFKKRWDYTGQLAPGNHTLKLVFATDTSSTYGSIDAVIVR